MSEPRHFLDLDALSPETLRRILDNAAALKAAGRNGARLLEGKSIATIFEQKSTRTRISFDIAMHQLGGHTIVMSGDEMQLGRGETVEDTGRVLARYVDGIVLRTDRHEKLAGLAQGADVPVINGLTNRTHPCQIMADILTFEEHRGPIKGRTVAWLGDGNNVAASWIQAATQFDFTFRMACPSGYEPDQGTLDWAVARQADVHVGEDIEVALNGADCVVTDTWVSLCEDGTSKSIAPLQPYQVNEAAMKHARDDAIFMHCLPAKRGREVSAGVLDGPQSVVFDEAENRVHAQKAILVWCLGEM